MQYKTSKSFERNSLDQETKLFHVLTEKSGSKIKKAPRFEGKRLKPDVGFAARFALSPVGGWLIPGTRQCTNAACRLPIIQCNLRQSYIALQVSIALQALIGPWDTTMH